MFKEFNEKMSGAAKNKAGLLKASKGRYILSSMFAGAFIGVGILLTFIIGGNLSLAKSPYTTIITGISFSIALSYVIFTGTELFTGNNGVMMNGVLNGTVSHGDLWGVWIFSYIGNIIGSLLISAIFIGTGLCDKEPVRLFFENASKAKAGAPFSQLLCRGILCNFLVCLAVFMCAKCKNEVAKLILVIMCIYPFVTSGFEHSVANMTVYGVSIMHSGIAVSLSDAMKNLVPVTIGNVIGGAIVVGAGFYALNGKEK